MNPLPPIIAGRYRVVGQLGQGSFGTTLLAEDESLGHKVVVKIARDADADATDTAAIIRREAKAFAALRHPNVARLFDVGMLDDGRPYLVIEWIEGANLRDILAGGPLPLHHALAVLRALAEALAAAHAAGIIHRDIKPSNVIVPQGMAGPLYDQAKLIDFGAFGRIRRSTGTTETGEIYGTFLYMSPEQLLGQEQSAATDVYGLGALFYEMLTGTTPFAGDRVAEVLPRIIGEAPAIPQGLPADARSLLERWLSKDPKARPASAAAALSEIIKVSDQIPPPTAAPFPVPLPGEDVDGTTYSPPPAPQGYPAPPIAPMPPPSWADTLSHTTAAPKSSGRSFKNIWLLLGGLVVASAVVIFVLSALAGRVELPINANVSATPTPGHAPSGASLVPGLLGVLLGVALAGGGILLAVMLRRWLGRRRSDLERDASSIIFGSRSREILTASLALQVDEVVLKVRRLDERILANTLAMMVREFEDARDSGDRQAALMNVAQLMEKLTARLAPWYVQYEKLIAFFVALVGIASGLVSVAASVQQMTK